MNRETLIPLVGLIGLFLAGTVMLYVTSGPPVPAEVGAQVAKGTKAPKTSPAKPTVDARALTTRRAVPVDRPEAPDGAKNVVLVVVSAWRKDQLAPYGGPEAVTPWLGELADQGARFDDAIAAGGWTRPAIASILTGAQALTLGLHDEGPTAGDVAVDTLPERLAAAGWYTMGVNAVPHANKATGLADGFDHYRDAHAQGYTTQHRLQAAEAVTAALTMLKSRKADEATRPFYLQLNLVDLHKPIKVPPAEFQPFSGPDHEIAPYRAVLNRVDKALARLDLEIEKLGKRDDTYVIVVGAIGEGLEMPAHHGHAHGRNVYPSTAEVPWVVRGPGVDGGRVVTGLASQLDVSPTILGLVGQASQTPEGMDWSAQVRAGGKTTRTDAILDTWYYQADRAAIYTSERACIRDFGSADLEGEAWRDGCWDRAADPDFTRPFEDPALMAKLSAWRTEAVANAPKAPPKPTPKKAPAKAAKAPDQP